MSDFSSSAASDLLRRSRVLSYTVGIVTLGAGAFLLFWPSATIRVVALILGILTAAVGFGEIVDALTTHRKGSYWGLLLVRGLVNLGVAAALVFWPDITVSVVIWLFGISVIVSGILGVVVSFRIPKERGRSDMMLRAFVSLAIGFLIALWPSATVRVITVVVGIGLGLWGLVMLWAGYRLSKGDVQVDVG